MALRRGGVQRSGAAGYNTVLGTDWRQSLQSHPSRLSTAVTCSFCRTVRLEPGSGTPNRPNRQVVSSITPGCSLSFPGSHQAEMRSLSAGVARVVKWQVSVQVLGAGGIVRHGGGAVFPEKVTARSRKNNGKVTVVSGAVRWTTAPRFRNLIETLRMAQRLVCLQL